jgi:hypothetical protein
MDAAEYKHLVLYFSDSLRDALLPKLLSEELSVTPEN